MSIDTTTGPAGGTGSQNNDKRKQEEETSNGRSVFTTEKARLHCTPLVFEESHRPHTLLLLLSSRRQAGKETIEDLICFVFMHVRMSLRESGKFRETHLENLLRGFGGLKWKSSSRTGSHLVVAHGGRG